jgi:hypothetical protein
MSYYHEIHPNGLDSRYCLCLDCIGRFGRGGDVRASLPQSWPLS